MTAGERPETIRPEEEYRITLGMVKLDMNQPLSNDKFVLEQPAWPFNESELTDNVTHWPDAWLRRR